MQLFEFAGTAGEVINACYAVSVLLKNKPRFVQIVL